AILCIAPMLTKEFLTNNISLINGLGGKMLGKLVKTRTVNDFLDMSLQFAGSIGFVSHRCQQVIDEMLANGYKCSTAMFGETVFSIVKNDSVRDVQRILSSYNGALLVCDIDYQGARML
ncbi:MAG: pantoate kinase, partial [Nitrososphaerales archaeon]